ncbi:hypothetical protein ADA01nite_30690 [Aneurinibacillus danicus]|jgi:hypothetical protein|uniref:Uncharacterized protein n=1 Tax=Aneurinibacillus danicus TaxID=267746 RepID=A0A511V9V2_9BACL|nr:hypothetical protein ADA01nite_30690 [Aneurinibacillus danicus]
MNSADASRRWTAAAELFNKTSGKPAGQKDSTVYTHGLEG